MLPSKDQAYQFALMLMTGVPGEDALRYFLPEEAVVDRTTLADLAAKWQRHPATLDALKTLQGGEWTKLTPKQRIELALDKTYNEMAYLLYTHNFAAETNPNVLNKMKEARTTLEVKVAGLAGKMTELAAFYADLTSGKLRHGHA